MLVVLGEAGIRTRDDFADLSVDEVVDVDTGILREHGLSESEASELIMAARAHWFEDDEAPGAETDEGGAQAEAAAASADSMG